MRIRNCPVQIAGDEITVTAQAYAKSVEIRNEEDNLVLSDNFFDMNAGTKTGEDSGRKYGGYPSEKRI